MKSYRKVWRNHYWRMTEILTRKAGLEFATGEIAKAAADYATARMKG
ncbi:hypothetical protein [Paenibacillus oleatilyticus]|uniref:Uncharacterized protein n=1 Tax=Paenibacillus oleatilyticus TaxID=2594886 RepID=A0ABV4VCD9_9BACL